MEMMFIATWIAAKMGMMLLIVWIALAIAVGLYAKNHRGRDQTGRTLAALIFSPLLAWAFVGAMQACAPHTALEIEDKRKLGAFLTAIFVGVIILYAIWH
jgi:hypothetical protein